jgi:magnesium transporter
MGKARYFAIGADGGIEVVSTVADALRRRTSGAIVWLDYPDPTEADLSALVEPLGLHPLAIEDCLDEDQVPKMDEFPGNTFILFNRFSPVPGGAVIEEVNFFLGERMLVSVHSHGRQDGEAFADHLEATVRRNLEQARRGSDFLLEVLLDDIVDEEFEAVEAIQDRLDAAEEEVLNGAAGVSPVGLIRLRRDLLQLRKSLVFEREVLVKLCRRDSPYISEQAIYHYRDIYDHLAKFFEVVEICRELIASIVEIHLAMVNNQMALIGNKTNHVVKRLTLITTVFMPLTLLASIGGMSEWSMMTGPHNWRVAYPAFVAGLIVLAVINYYLLKWVDARDKADLPLPSSLVAAREERAPDATPALRR